MYMHSVTSEDNTHRATHSLTLCSREERRNLGGVLTLFCEGKKKDDIRHSDVVIQFNLYILNCILSSLQCA